ncbi:MAG: hypothetical protein IT365_23445 [Candidatus Hydrogenedentes bacterium]|nr:hypothetical protein [Candidatus Hydrogenedentota bacterium]
MTLDFSEHVAGAIRRRLCARRAELDSFRKSLEMQTTPTPPPSQGVHVTDDGGAPDPEEALRLCMVKYVPRLAQGTLSPEQLDEYLHLLSRIGEHCVSSDLRYLDAYHVAYELFLKRGDFQSTNLLRPFLERYRAALSAYVRFLDERAVNRES